MERQEQYEGIFVLDPELSDEALAKVQAQMQEQVKKLEGTVEHQQPWGRRRLAYRLGKCREGFYVLVRFFMRPSCLGTLDQWCALNEAILRRLIVCAAGGPPQPMEAVTSHGEPE